VEVIVVKPEPEIELLAPLVVLVAPVLPAPPAPTVTV
jgi:hypothetical protein